MTLALPMFSAVPFAEAAIGTWTTRALYRKRIEIVDGRTEEVADVPIFEEDAPEAEGLGFYCACGADSAPACAACLGACDAQAPCEDVDTCPFGTRSRRNRRFLPIEPEPAFWMYEARVSAGGLVEERVHPAGWAPLRAFGSGE